MIIMQPSIDFTVYEVQKSKLWTHTKISKNWGITELSLYMEMALGYNRQCSAPHKCYPTARSEPDTLPTHWELCSKSQKKICEMNITNPLEEGRVWCISNNFFHLEVLVWQYIRFGRYTLPQKRCGKISIGETTIFVLRLI